MIMSRDSGAGNNIKSSYSFYVSKGVMFGLTCHRKPKAQTWRGGVSPFYTRDSVFKAFSATSERTLVSFVPLKALKYTVLKLSMSNLMKIKSVICL